MSSVFMWVLGALFAAQVATSEVQYPVLNSDFAGNITHRENLVQKQLEGLSAAQSEAVRDRNPLLYEAMKEFNRTMLVQAHAYALLLSSIGTGKDQCDNVAKQTAEELIKKNRDQTVACLITYRNEVLKEGAGHQSVRELPPETIERLVNPIATCFDEVKISMVKDVGRAMATHALCVNKV